MKFHSKNKSIEETEEKGLTVCLSPVYPRPQLPLVCFYLKGRLQRKQGLLGNFILLFVLKENSDFPTDRIGFQVPSKHGLTDATLQENRVSYFSSSQYLSSLMFNNRQFLRLTRRTKTMMICRIRISR